MWEVSGLVPLEAPRDLWWFRRILKTVLFLGRRLFEFYPDGIGLQFALGGTDVSTMSIPPGQERRGLSFQSFVSSAGSLFGVKGDYLEVDTRDSAFPESSWGTGQEPA